MAPSTGLTRVTTGSIEEDPYCKAYFALLGIGYLFPFSAMIQPVDFWNHVFPSFNILFHLTACYNYINLICLSLIVFFDKPQNDGVTFIKRIGLGFGGQFLVLMAVPTFYFWNLSERANYIFVMLCMAIMGVVTSLLDSAAISFSFLYPTRMQEMQQLGIGLSTLTGSIFRVLTKGVFSSKAIISSSVLYFFAGCAVLVVCMASFFLLLLRPLSLAVFKRTGIKHPLQDWSYFKSFEAKWYQESVSESNFLIEPLVTESQSNLGSYRSQDEVEKQECIDSESSSESKLEVCSPLTNTSSTKMALILKALPNHLLVSALFGVSLMVWPGLVTELKCQNFKSLQENGWWPLILLLFFSISDVIGRLCVRWPLGITAKTIWLPVLCRAFVVPLIILSVTEKVPFLVNDFLSVGYVLFLGFTNGYVGTLVIIVVNQLFDDPQEKKYIGSLTSFYLNAGLVLGSTVGLLVEGLVKPINP